MTKLENKSLKSSIEHLNEVYYVFKYKILIDTGEISNSILEVNYIKSLLKLYLESSKEITEDQIIKAKEHLKEKGYI